jgi:hypothetical protein
VGTSLSVTKRGDLQHAKHRWGTLCNTCWCSSVQEMVRGAEPRWSEWWPRLQKDPQASPDTWDGPPGLPVQLS